MGSQPVNVDVNSEVRGTLLEAIYEADLPRLRQVLKEGIRENNGVFEWLKGKLLAEAYSEDEDEEEEEEEDEDDKRRDGPAYREYTEETTKEPKRLCPRYAICENCEEKFDFTDNEFSDCSFHTGLSPLHLPSLF